MQANAPSNTRSGLLPESCKPKHGSKADMTKKLVPAASAVPSIRPLFNRKTELIAQDYFFIPKADWEKAWRNIDGRRFSVARGRFSIIVPPTGSYPHLTLDIGRIDSGLLDKSEGKKEYSFHFKAAHYSESLNGRGLFFSAAKALNY